MIKLEIEILLSDLTENGLAIYPTEKELTASVIAAWLSIREDILKQKYSYRKVKSVELVRWH